MGVATGIVLSLGLLVVSRLLFRPPKVRNQQDYQPTTLSLRGSYVNTIIGTRRTGYVFAWAGNRRSKKKKSGGKGMGGSSTTTINWYEDAWHCICPGPVVSLKAILFNNKRVWDTEITAAASPSGTTFTLANGMGSFTIYWGEGDQAIDADISAWTGVASRWPYLCHIKWTRALLGSSPTWPQVEYVVRCGCEVNKLQESEYWLTGGDAQPGVNLAHALTQVLAAPYPHGMAIPLNKIDDNTFEAAGVLIESELLIGNILIEGGEPAAKVVQEIITDAGISLSQYKGKLIAVTNREVSSGIPLLDDDVVAPPDAEPVIDHGDNDINRVTFTFKNEANWSYKEQDIKFDDNGEQIPEFASVNAQTIDIATATDSDVANAIANRRAQESAHFATEKLTGLRGAKHLYIGQVFDRTGLGRLRVLSMQRHDDSPKVEIEAAPDIYGVIETADNQPAGGGTDTILDVAVDPFVAWRQLPESIVGAGEIKIAVFRIRAHEQISGSQIWGSVDATNYTYMGDQDMPAAGGEIESGIDIADPSPIAVGPVFVSDSTDAADILDLSADSISHAAGRQVAVINNEVFFLESVTVQAVSDWAASTAYIATDDVIPTGISTGLRYVCTTPGTSGTTEPTWPTLIGETVTDGTVTWTASGFRYQMNNLIRAQHDSVAATHAIGDRVWIMDSEEIEQLGSLILSSSSNLYVKSVCHTSSQAVDIADVTPVSGTLL